MKVIIGKPFKLCKEPMEKVSDEDLERASARLREEFDKLAYGPHGVNGWVGPILKDGAPVDEPVELGPAPETVPIPEPDPEEEPIPPTKRGVVQLLWQCPVCQTDDALVHTRRRFRPQTVNCQACATRWELEPRQGNDFRLRVLEGTPQLASLDMPLSKWYAEMKRRAKYHTISVPGAELLPGESAHLVKDDVPLIPYRPNALFDGYAGRQPPTTQLRDKRDYADWESIGEGRLVLTDRRLLWQGEQGELDFFWSDVNAVYLFLGDVLAVRYGTANYRFKITGELALRWLSYASEMARRQSAVDGHKVTITHY
jgi:hypothetical protein